MPDAALTRVLTEIQRRGGIGPVPIADAIAHSERFVAALPEVVQACADLGSGGGLPGLVLAVRRPDLSLHLIERRTTRADLLRYAVAALDLGARVTVHGQDAARLALTGIVVDVVTARSFASPHLTLATAAALLTSGGWVLISAAPGALRSPLAAAGRLEHVGLERVDLVAGIWRYRRR